VADEQAIRGFLSKTDEYARNLRAHEQDGNELILSAVDRLLREIARAQAAKKRPKKPTRTLRPALR